MIYDTKENFHRYKGIHPALDCALSFLETTDLDQLPMGITQINGDKFYANIMEADLKKTADFPYEFHRKYADIQLDLEGEEKIGIGFFPNESTSSYREQEDFGTVECSKEIKLPLGKEHFVICFINEPHKPGLLSNENSFVKKCVIKVLMEG